MNDAVVLYGDVLEQLDGLPEKSVHLIVTSPPYFNLRDYQTDAWEGGHPLCSHKAGKETSRASKGKQASNAHASIAAPGTCRKCGAQRVTKQIGLEATVREYEDKLAEVFRKAMRVLRDDGTLFLNLGDSYSSGAERAKPYGTYDKAPEDCQDHGCLCESLCDACRKAYQIGKSHNDTLLVPMPVSSPCAPIPEHTASVTGHLPTLDFVRQENRSADAISDPEHSQAHADELLPAFHLSTTDESYQQHQEYSPQSDTPLVCLLCGTSLAQSVPASERKKVCPCDCQTTSRAMSDQRASKTDNEAIDDSSVDRISGKAYDLAYPHFTTQSRQTQGLRPKNLIGVPWRIAFALQADGWYLRAEIIWEKLQAMPESTTDRPTRSHEHIFLFSKKPTYYYDTFAVRERSTAQTGRPADFKRGTKDQVIPGQRSAQHRTDRKPTSDTGWRNLRDVWSLNSEPSKGDHYAAFPTEIPRRAILAGTSARGVCTTCGAPWKRVIERKKIDRDVEAERSQNATRTGRTDGKVPGPSGKIDTVESIGWLPTCACYGIPPMPEMPDEPDEPADIDAGAPETCDRCNGEGVIPGPPMFPEPATCGKCKGTGGRPASQAWLDWQAESQAWQAECDRIMSDEIKPLLASVDETMQTVPATVLDPFLGTGTTIAAAVSEGRHGIGIELNRHYCDTATRRIERTQRGLKLY